MFDQSKVLIFLFRFSKGGAARGRSGNGKKAASHFESKCLGRSLLAILCSICWSGFNHTPLYHCTHKSLINPPPPHSPFLLFPPVTKVSSQQGKSRKDRRMTWERCSSAWCVFLCVCQSERVAWSKVGRRGRWIWARPWRTAGSKAPSRWRRREFTSCSARWVEAASSLCFHKMLC